MNDTAKEQADIQPKAFGSGVSSTKVKGGKRKSSSLPGETVEYLKNWMMSPQHIAHPYPTEQEKAQIMADTGIELKQLTNWFVNNRKRYWKPRVEARLQQQAQAAAVAVQAHAAAVAAVTVAAHVNPVTPEVGYKPTVTTTTFPPNNGFLSFDISSPHLVGTDLSKILGTRGSSPSVHAVSETSSSASTTVSEGDISDTETEDESIPQSQTRGASKGQSTAEIPRAEQLKMSKPAPQESSMEACTLLPTKRRVDILQSPRKKFRRVSLELWRNACQKAASPDDKGLPSLDEATRLFGFAY